ncbi:hypothetical protein CDD83_4221 [Cordyceps sp. RAO-2017]|nr:hypothetical protein CDD83_4221 [Cordyceps sp. RAO-2017]
MQQQNPGPSNYHLEPMVLSFPSKRLRRLGTVPDLQRLLYAVRAYLSPVLVFLLPSFVQRWLWPDIFPPRRLSSTSWLDGLRGVAAVPVILLHHTCLHFGSYSLPWGVENEGELASPIKLPFVRLVFSGDVMVHLFFIISGFAVSYKPLQCVRRGDLDALARTVSSTAFRRGFRLFLPAFACCLGLAVLSRLGWVAQPPRLPTLAEQLWDLGTVCWKIGAVMPWAWDAFDQPAYNYALWSIPIEYSCSLLLLVVVVGLSRLKPGLRLAFLLALVACCFKAGHWGAAEFLVGMGLAEANLIGEATRDARGKADDDLPLSEDTLKPALFPSRPHVSARPTARLVVNAVLLGNLIFGLFLAGWTSSRDAVSRAPGLSWFYSRTVEPYWSGEERAALNCWLFVAAVQIMLALQQIKPLQRPFVTPVAQYLGDISFSIYVVHVPWVHESGPVWMPYVWAMVGGPDNLGVVRRLLAWLLSVVVLFIPIVWSGDVFWRLVDRNCVRFARWFEALCVKA